MLTRHVHEMMVAEECHERLGGKVQHALAGGGPDRPGKRQKIAITEPVPSPQFAQELADRHAGMLQCGLGIGVEMQDVAQHPQETRIGRTPALREKLVERAERIFHASAAERGAKAHLAGHIGHLKPVKQTCQVRVVHLVEDDKVGIGRLVSTAARQDGARMPPKARLCFEQRHVSGV